MKLSRVFSGLGATSALIALTLSACSGGSSSMPTVSENMTQSAQQASGASTDQFAAWHEAVVHSTLPAAGCFQASYPSFTWTRMACSTPPNLLYPHVGGVGMQADAMHTDSVGDGADFTADVAPKTMSTAVGSFPVVTGVTSVKSVTNPAFGCCGENGKNSYTLQLNSYFFTSSACGSIKNCEGWEQFVYENPPSGQGSLFIQDWLIPTTSSGLTGCPSGKGWEFADGGCVQNSPSSVSVPNISITKLAQLTETGTASSSGDSVYLSVGSTVYGMKNIQSDGITDLYGHWQGAEFNVIGNAGGDIANFNAGSTIQVRLEADTGSTTAPSCPANSGTTGESNNLSFVKAPSNPSELQYPSVLFTMSNAGGGSASCDTVAGI